MLRAWVLALGVLTIVAGCTGPRQDALPNPGEDCLLGGPPRAPPDDRSAFNLTDDHAAEHPNLTRVFSQPRHLIPVTCEAGSELMAHLSNEGADVGDGPHEYTQNVYLTYNGTTHWVSLQLRQ